MRVLDPTYKGNTYTYRVGHHTSPSRFTSLSLRVAENVSDEVGMISRQAHFDDTGFLVDGRVIDVFF